MRGTGIAVPASVRGEVTHLLVTMALGVTREETHLMTLEANSKVQARHLKRHAYLYVRQSSLHQVLEHTESTQRQYNLKQRAIALGWAHDQIVVVDNDQE